MSNPPMYHSSLFTFDAASNTFTAEASALGLAPGVVPATITIVSARTGATRAFHAAECPLLYHGAGEDRCIAGWKFVLGSLAVVVLNT